MEKQEEDIQRNTLSAAIRQVGGPKEAWILLRASDIELFKGLSQSTVFRWIRDEEKGDPIESARLATEFLWNWADYPEPKVFVDAFKRIAAGKDVIIPDRYCLRCIVVPHPASLPLGVFQLSEFCNKNIQPASPAAIKTTRIALGLRLSVEIGRELTTLQALDRIYNGQADCTIVPKITFRTFNSTKQNKLFDLCRVARGANLVLRRGRNGVREVLPNQKVRILIEKLPNITETGSQFDDWIPPVKLDAIENVKPFEVQKVVDAFRSDADQVLFYGSASCQRQVREALTANSDSNEDIFLESDDKIRGESEWFLCMHEKWKPRWRVLRGFSRQLRVLPIDCLISTTNRGIWKL